MRAFNNVKKHKLLHLKSCLSIKLQPAFYDRRRHEELLRVNLTLYKIKAYIKKLTSQSKTPEYGRIKGGSDTSFTVLQQAQDTLTELLTTNVEAIKNQQNYNNDFYKNITKSFYA